MIQGVQEAETLLALGQRFYKAIAVRDRIEAIDTLHKCKDLVKLMVMMRITFMDIHAHFETRLKQKITCRNDRFLVEVEKMFEAELKGHRGGYKDRL